MKKLLLLSLLFFACRASAQNPLAGQFFNFSDSSKIGILPFFSGWDDPRDPEFASFFPSVFRQYTDERGNLLYGLDLDISKPLPQAKFEINVHPVGSLQADYPGLWVYGGITGINAEGRDFGMKAHGAIGVNALGTDIGLNAFGTVGLDVTGDARGIYIHSNSLDPGYGIYQTGNAQSLNYFMNRTGIGTENPVATLDVAGNLNCNGPASIGNLMDLYTNPGVTRYPIRTDASHLDFLFPDQSNSGSGGQTAPSSTIWHRLMSLICTSDSAAVSINGLVHSLGLIVDGKSTTKQFRMTDDAGLGKALISDKEGNGLWTDISPWIDRYWVFNDDHDMFSQGRNIGIGVPATDSSFCRLNKVTVISNATPNGLFVQYSGTGQNRHGIESVLINLPHDPGGGGNTDKPDGGVTGSGNTADAIYAKVISSSDMSEGGAVSGVHAEVFDNGACQGGVYGIRSVIGGSFLNNKKYGIYSEISQGTPNSKWAGYFKGGDVEIDQGSLIIGRAGDKRFCMQTKYWQTGQHSLYIFPSNGTSWAADKGIALADDGNFYVNGKIYAREIEVNLDNYQIPDYVFAPEYNLLPLNELETYVKANRHLPEIPSADDIKTNGANLGEMNAALLKKVEELTLYVIELKKEINGLKGKGN